MLGPDDMLQLDIIGHISYLALAIGMWRIGNGDGSGWAFRFLGELGWVGISLKLGLTSGVIWGAVFLALDAFGLYAARKVARND